MEQLEPYLKPKTSGANISPFSTKNLPKSNYSVSDEDLIAYKEIVANVDKNKLIMLAHITKEFISSLAVKKKSAKSDKMTWEEIKADMAKKCLKGKEYIHSIGMWDEYIKYLRNHI